MPKRSPQGRQDGKAKWRIGRLWESPRRWKSRQGPGRSFRVPARAHPPEASEGPAPLASGVRWRRRKASAQFGSKTGLDAALWCWVQVRRLEGSSFGSIRKVRENGARGDFGSRAVLRSRTELAPDRGCEGSRFGACSGRLTWRQKAGGSLPVDAADGPDFEAFALRRRVRRRGKGALLPDDAAKDRGRGACFSCDVRQRMDRGLLRFEAAN